MCTFVKCKINGPYMCYNVELTQIPAHVQMSDPNRMTDCWQTVPDSYFKDCVSGTNAILFSLNQEFHGVSITKHSLMLTKPYNYDK